MIFSNLGQLVDPATHHCRADSPVEPIHLWIAPPQLQIVSEASRPPLGVDHKRVLAFIRGAEHLVYIHEVRTACKLSITRAGTIMHRLLANGYLRRFGRRKSYRYGVWRSDLES